VAKLSWNQIQKGDVPVEIEKGTFTIGMADLTNLDLF